MNNAGIPRKKPGRKNRGMNEERYLWFCQFQYHGQGHLWWAYFKDQQEVESCLKRVRELLPCLEITLLEEQPEGLAMANDYLYYRLSRPREEIVRCKRERIRMTFRMSPAPIKRDSVTAFLCSLDKLRFCARCEPTFPQVRAIVAAARRKKVPERQPGSVG